MSSEDAPPDPSERLATAETLIREAIEQLSPPVYFGPGSWWERAHDFLAAGSTETQP